MKVTKHYTETECPCCAETCIQPDRVSCINCEEGGCEEQGGRSEHDVGPWWYERADIHCRNCGCIYELVLCGEGQISVNWSCDDDESIECACCASRGIEKTELEKSFELLTENRRFDYDQATDIVVREQVKFPRSKKRRIRKKWQKDDKNFRCVLLKNAYPISITFSIEESEQ